MATYNLGSVSGALVQTTNVTGTTLGRLEYHYNPNAQGGLAANDTVYVDVTVPAWARSVVFSKAFNTANADVLSVQVADAALLAANVIPTIKNGQAANTLASSNVAAGNAAMICQPMGNIMRFKCTFNTAVPSTAILSVAFYDF